MIKLYSPEQWSKYAEQFHFIVFNEYRSNEVNRIDYALTAWDDLDLIGYFTLRELDSDSIYIGYGGVIPKERKSMKSYNAFMELLGFLKSKYLRATTLVENTNIQMIKMYFKAGFLITGIKNFKNTIYLELSNEWGANG